MDGFNAKTALETFIRYRGEGTFFPPEWEDKLSIEEAYAVQLALVDHLGMHGMRRIGWKVGLTAKPIQDQFSVHEPGFGFLMDDAPHQTGVVIPHDSLIGPGFENEICVAMGAPLRGPGVTAADARAAIATIAPSFELVETRHPRLKTVQPLAYEVRKYRLALVNLAKILCAQVRRKP